MSLKHLVDTSRTDKDTTHSYLDLYDKLLSKRKETGKNILEIGSYQGGSIKLWADYFTNATNYIRAGCLGPGIVSLYFSTKNIKFDFILDDGPHTIQSMKTLSDDGILIIEDVQSIDWLHALIDETPDNLKQFVKIYDLRENKNRYDDIVFIIDKSS